MATATAETEVKWRRETEERRGVGEEEMEARRGEAEAVEDGCSARVVDIIPHNVIAYQFHVKKCHNSPLLRQEIYILPHNYNMHVKK